MGSMLATKSISASEHGFGRRLEALEIAYPLARRTGSPFTQTTTARVAIARIVMAPQGPDSCHRTKGTCKQPEHTVGNSGPLCGTLGTTFSKALIIWPNRCFSKDCLIMRCNLRHKSRLFDVQQDEGASNLIKFGKAAISRRRGRLSVSGLTGTTSVTSGTTTILRPIL